MIYGKIFVLFKIEFTKVNFFFSSCGCCNNTGCRKNLKRHIFWNCVENVVYASFVFHQKRIYCNAVSLID